MGNSETPDLSQPKRGPEIRRKRCPFCAEEIAVDAIKCRFCRSMLVPMQMAEEERATGLIQPGSSPKDPLLMALLSGCCLAGVGQMVLGQVTKGLVLMFGTIVLGLLTGGLSVFLTFPLLAIDAYQVARKLKAGESVSEWECFPG